MEAKEEYEKKGIQKHADARQAFQFLLGDDRDPSDSFALPDAWYARLLRGRTAELMNVHTHAYQCVCANNVLVLRIKGPGTHANMGIHMAMQA